MDIKNVTPLKIIAEILHEERALSAEIVLLALNIVRNNPDVDLALSMMIARDEWVSSPEYKAMSKSDLDDIDNTMVESAEALKESHEVLKQNRGIL